MKDALYYLAMVCLAAVLGWVVWLIATFPESRCRSVCVRDHTELRVSLRPSYSGNGRLESDVMNVSVCDERREVCRPEPMDGGRGVSP